MWLHAKKAAIILGDLCSNKLVMFVRIFLPQLDTKCTIILKFLYIEKDEKLFLLLFTTYFTHANTAYFKINHDALS